MAQTISQEWRDLTRNERDALVALSQEPGQSEADIHRRIRGEGEPQTISTTHRCLQSLISEGYVRRERAGNKTRSYLTDAGERVLEQSPIGV